MEKEKQRNRAEQFVAFILDRCARDRGCAARLRRADNPDTEYQSYDTLVRFGVDIEKEYERLPFAFVGAALARLQNPVDGTVSLGSALKSCFEDGEQGDLRLRRLLACTSQDELCRILRPLLTLVAAKGKKNVCHARLLQEMLFFNLDNQRQRIRLRWASDYYRYTPDAAEDDKDGQED